MTYIDAFNIIEAFREDLECAVKHDLYVTLTTEQAEELLKALDSVDY